MPKSKELLFLCRNVGTGQRSALLHCLCFSPHLTPSFFWNWNFFFFLLPHSSVFQYTLFAQYLPPFTSSSLLFCLLTHSHFNVSASYLNSCFSFLSHVSQPYIHAPSLSSPLITFCLPPSVPAGGRGPLSAAAAAQGQLPDGGAEAGQHPERMPRGDLHL